VCSKLLALRVTWYISTADGATEGCYAPSLQLKGERFLQRIRQLAQDLKIKAGDVVYFTKGDGKTFMYCGLWERGSAEAQEFTKALLRSHTKL